MNLRSVAVLGAAVLVGAAAALAPRGLREAVKGLAKMDLAEKKETNDWTMAAEDAARLHVTTPCGAIRVTASEGDDIALHAEKQVRGSHEAAVEAFLKEIEVERRRDGDAWVVEARWPMPPPLSIRSVGVNLRIEAPARLRVEADAHNGQIEVEGMASVRVHTANGRVSVRNVKGGVDAETRNGAMDLGLCAGGIQARTSNGKVSASSCEGSLALSTSNGAVEVQGATGPLEASTSNGAIEASLVQASVPVQVDLKTSNGAIHLVLPQGLNARLDAETRNGRVDLGAIPGAQYNERHTQAQATQGDGSGQVRLRTSNGAIQVTSQ